MTRKSGEHLRTTYIFINPFSREGYDTRSIFKRSLTGLNLKFSFYTSCLTKAEEPSLPYYSPIAGGRIIGFIPFPRVLVLCEIQSTSSRMELESQCSFTTTITITPRAPPYARHTDTLDSCFDLIRSHQQRYTVIFTTGDRTSDHRLQSRNSTTEPTVHIVHK